ncbi:hypothetical protein [Streptomyces sp. NPDC058625]|uniref:hypothetical protein n=1 Tax=Streptomyces sp. NPDC058625 TaxID=3346564 RepID=UPI003653C522
MEELERRESKRTRFHHRLTIPCRVKNHTLRIRVDETPEDREIDPSTKRQRFNRTEHLRQIPPDTHTGRRLKGFRRDSESQHSRFGQGHPHKRVPAYGTNAALLIYIGYAWLSNSVARAKITHALAGRASTHISPSSDQAPPATLTAVATPSRAATTTCR